jgi:type I restriction enzyme M protein
MTATPKVQNLSNFIWSVADLLRGPYRPPQYERVMLPMVVLRRFDCVLAATKPQVLAKYAEMERLGKVARLGDGIDRELNPLAVQNFHNHSRFDFETLKGDPENIGQNLMNYVEGFSANVRTIFRAFDFEKEVEKLVENDRLFLIIQQFASMDLGPSEVDNIQMGLLFEDLIRRFNEAANETAGDHFTPREVIHLMVNLLLEPDLDYLKRDAKIITIYDPTCGTGGMLSEGESWLRDHNSKLIIKTYGQDYNQRSYAVAASDLLIKGQDADNIRRENTLTKDQFPDDKFNYLLANPPYGVDWKGQQSIIESEHKQAGYAGRFGPKLPRVNDGALLFLLHMISKFQNRPHENDPLERGSRAAVIFNGSPLFTGGAGSGESEIRRWILENDLLEAIVALPEQMFYNTGIGTFLWVVSNRKTPERQGRLQLIDARDRWTLMRRSLGDKRRYLSDETIDTITREHGDFTGSHSAHSKTYANTYFGYRRITVERPLRLRFQVTREAKERFLDTLPDYLNLVRELERQVGSDIYDDWNSIRERAELVGKQQDIKWTARSRKLFRDAFTTIHPDAEPVIAKRGHFAGTIGAEHFPTHDVPRVPEAELDALFGIYPDPSSKGKRQLTYEADSNLRDSENVPLQEHPIDFFEREVRPYVTDAWIDPDSADEKDGGVGKVGYEINFNREFFTYEALRPLAEIDAELSEVENRILKLLQEVTA